MPDFKEFLLSCPKIDEPFIFERQKDLLEQSERDKRILIMLDEIDKELAQHAGVIPPDVDVRQEYYDYLEKKHS